MALKRKKIKSSDGKFLNHPVTCYLCKEKKAFHTMHGGYVGHYNRYGGKTCCNDCFPSVKEEERKHFIRENDCEMSEADYQTWGRL
ncbi:hypothetical protein LCM23_25005 [Cytobacillus kochii]|uniref:hypothetical protein n=1 Tax=Cytobacillus kochii TaxID=859143 RepID=UPI001CD59159|nr:hypothetical protein [Cytobacillus kochii]MCA1029274.1 hypothetical protein [Cytobacillus kochii]